MKLMVIFEDDILVVLDKVKGQPDDSKEFKSYLNKASNFNWSYEELGEAIVLIDLDIWVYHKVSTRVQKSHTKNEYILLCLHPHYAYLKGA